MSMKSFYGIYFKIISKTADFFPPIFIRINNCRYYGRPCFFVPVAPHLQKFVVIRVMMDHGGGGHVIVKYQAKYFAIFGVKYTVCLVICGENPNPSLTFYDEDFPVG